MYPNPYPPPNNGMVKIVLILIAIGVLLGILLTDSVMTRINRNSNKTGANVALSATAANVSVISNLHAEPPQTKIEVKNNQDVNNKAVQNSQMAYLKELNAQISTAAVSSAKIFGTITTSVGFSIFMIMIAPSLSSFIRLKALKNDAWQDINLRKARIQLARQRERLTRSASHRKSQSKVVPPFYTDQDAPISWEDIQRQFAESKKKRDIK